MASFYNYESEYRSPMKMGATVFATLFFGISYWVYAPTALVVFAGVIMALLCYNWVRNPVSGVEIRSHHIRAYTAGWERRANIRDIDTLKILRRDEWDDLFVVLLKGGKKFHIPDICIGDTARLEQVARQMGIEVEIVQRPSVVLAKS